MIEIKIISRQPWGEISNSIKKVSRHELLNYKKLARNYPSIDWGTFPENIKHIVFYSELYDAEGNEYYANVYLNGCCDACTEEDFEKKYQRAGQYTFAIHRK